MSFKLDQAMIFYYFFMGFYFLFISVGGVNLFGLSLGSLPAPNPIVPIEPTILEAIWFALNYAIQNIAFFFTLMLTSSTFAFLNFLVFAPALVIIWMWVLKLIRGTG